MDSIGNWNHGAWQFTKCCTLESSKHEVENYPKH